MGDLMKLIRNNSGKNGDEELNSEDFKKYFRKF